jgi:hypothetical protein
VDLLKLDIEGAEFEVIESTPDSILRSIGQITVEFHDFQPRFAGRGLFERARRRLVNLGFACCLMSFRSNGDVLFLNSEQLRLRAGRRFYCEFGARWVEKFRSLRQVS